MEATLRNLKTAIFKVMETMFFILPDPDDDMLTFREEDEEEMYSIHIGLTGSPAYIISLTFERSLAHEMAEALLGVSQDDIDDETVHKCLKETINIIAGNLLLDFEEEKDRNITLPTNRKDELFNDKTKKNTETLHVFFGGKPVTAVLDILE